MKEMVCSGIYFFRHTQERADSQELRVNNVVYKDGNYYNSNVFHNFFSCGLRGAGFGCQNFTCATLFYIYFNIELFTLTACYQLPSNS